ncbi:ferredoxin [Actinomycetes bacterium KLBMP 9759]
MRVTVDGDRCIGAGQCVLAAPEVFDQDDDGTVVLLQDRPPAELHGVAQQAAQLCPAMVIGVGAAVGEAP